MTAQIIVGLILAGAAVWAWRDGTPLRSLAFGALAVAIAAPEAGLAAVDSGKQVLATSSASSLILLAVLAVGFAVMLGWNPRRKAQQKR